MSGEKPRPWYEGENRDVLFYILIAIFFLEMIIGGVAFFYGIVRATPEIPGGPPVARFPWMGWAISAISAPAAFLLIVRAGGSLLAGRDDAEGADSDHVPRRVKIFYATIRNAPAIVILVALLALGACLFFIDGAFRFALDFGSALVPYLPWIAGSAGGLIAFWILVRAILAYRWRKLELEHAWRREVLEKTGLVIAGKNSAIAADARQSLPAAKTRAISADVIDVSPADRDPSAKADENPDKIPGGE